MATEKRISVKLDELDIVLVCKECRARTVYPLTRWNPGGIPRCTNCNNPADSSELLSLKTALKNAIAAKDIPFEIRLEFPER